MKRILVPIDGSARALDTLRGVLRRGPLGVDSIELVNVQPLLNRHIAQWIPKRVRDGWRAERSATALAPAVRLAEASGLRFRVHAVVGERRAAIAQAARDWACDEIAQAPTQARDLAPWLALPAGLGLIAWLIFD